MISAPSICRWAGPIIDILLDYVGCVTLCSRLMEHLNSYSEWSVIKDKAGEFITDYRLTTNQLVTIKHGGVDVTCLFSSCLVWFPAAPPRPLLQLCRLQILQVVGRRHLKKLPLPGGLIRFLKHQEGLLEDC